MFNSTVLFLFNLGCSGNKVDSDTAIDDTQTDDSWWEDTNDSGDTSDTDTDTDTDQMTDFSEDLDLLESDLQSLLASALPMDLTNPDFQNNVTVPSSTSTGYGPMFTILISLSFDEDGELSCPYITGEIAEDGNQTEDVFIEGGCVDEGGVSWEGNMLYNGYGVFYDNLIISQQSEGCLDMMSSTTYNGGVIFSYTGINTVLNLDIQEQDESCEPISYTLALLTSLTIGEDEETTLYNGSGSMMVMDESQSMVLSADILTADELVDETVCEFEPISGSNTISAGSNTLEFMFDGETDCDETPTQMMSLNGEEAVEVEGVGCSTASQKGSLVAVLMSLVGLVGIRRRSFKA